MLHVNVLVAAFHKNNFLKSFFMETTTQTVDLIDDIWIRIFNSLDCRVRASLLQVCKRWYSVLANPICWLELNVTFSREQQTGSETASFRAFLAKYCSLTSKINIEVFNSQDWESIFLALYPLNQLRYLRFLVGQNSIKVKPLSEPQWISAPNWPNLVYFNIGNSSPYMFDTAALSRILQGAPNLEELYLHHYSFLQQTNLMDILKPLHKLKHLSIQKDVIRPNFGGFGHPGDIDPGVVLSQAPHLQTLYLFSNYIQRPGEFAFGQPREEPFCRTFGNTFVVSTNLLQSRELETVKKVGQFLKRSNYAYYFLPPSGGNFAQGIQPQEFSFELLDYLFKELKLDINCNTMDPTNPFVADFFNPILNGLPLYPLCPLSSVINNVDQVRKMLELGADPNIAHENMSPFALSNISKDSCLLLLERGADPMKKVKGKVALAHLLCSNNISNEDMAEIVRVMLDKGIVKSNPDSETNLLEIAIEHSLQETALVLIAHGAQWTARAMDHLITWNHQWWKEVISGGAFNVNKLSLSTVLRAVKLGLYDQVRDYLAHQSRNIDTNGFALVHYLSELPYISSPTKTSNAKYSSFTTLTVSFDFGFPRETQLENSSPKSGTARKKTPEQLDSVPYTIPLAQLIKELNLDVNTKSTKGQTPLLLVCESATDDANTVTTLIECGAHVNEADENGWTPLHAALYLHNYDTVKVLLSHGANINAQDRLGITPVAGFVLSLKWVKDEEMAIWTHLLDLGTIDHTITDKLLHFVCLSRHFELLNALLHTLPDLDVNCRDANDFTPLHYAVIGHDEDMTSLLLDRGADPNAVTNTLKLTPMATMLAILTKTSPYHRYVKSYVTLGDNRASFSTSSLDTEGGNPLEIIKFGIPSWLSDSETHGRTRRPVEDLMSLIPVPTDLHVTDQFGNNCLHDIVRSLDSLRPLVAKKNMFPEAINELWSVPNKFGTTPFHVYAKHTFFSPLCQIDEAESLLLAILKLPRIVDSLNSKDEYGKTGLDYLLTRVSYRPALSSHVKSVLYEMQGLKFVSSMTETALSLPHIAIENDTLDHIMLSKIAESDPEALNRKVNGKTPLILYISEKLLTCHENPHLPVPSSWIKIIDTFLTLKVDLNAQDNHGNTALHYACFFFHLGGWSHHLLDDAHLFSLVLFKLLDAGARVDIANTSGQTALDIIPNLHELDRSLVHRVKVRSTNKGALKETSNWTMNSEATVRTRTKKHK